MADEKCASETTKPKAKKRSWLKKVAKVLLWTLLGLFLLFVSLVAFRNFLIVAAIRNIGPKIAGVKMDVEYFSSAPNGAIYIRNLRIGNPPGFSQRHLFKISSLYMKLDLPSMFGKMPVIEIIESRDVIFNYEFNKENISNIDVIQNNVDKFLGPPEPEVEDPETREAYEECSVLLRQLNISKMKLQSGLLSLPLPDISLRNLGGTSSLRLALREYFAPLVKSVYLAGSSVPHGISSVGDAGKKLLNSGMDAGTKISNRVVKFFNTQKTKEKKRK